MLCGDRVAVIIEGVEYECKVYGEVYKPKYWKALGTPGPNHLAAIEVYINKHVYEIPIHKVIT